MKSLIEIFQLMKEHHYLMNGGLCNLAKQLYFNGYIDLQELNGVAWYISNNRPTRYSCHYNKEHKDSLWYWPRNDWAPRERWINTQIRKLSGKTTKV